MIKLAQAWAQELGITIARFLGNGDYGEAFETSDGNVIKITQDFLEYELSTEMIGIDSDYVAEIFAVKRFDDDFMGVWQEKLIIDDTYHQSLFEELVMAADEQQCDLMSINPDDCVEPLSTEALLMFNDLSSAVRDISLSGHEPDDVHFTNIGRKQHGQFALFDQRIAA